MRPTDCGLSIKHGQKQDNMFTVLVYSLGPDSLHTLSVLALRVYVTCFDTTSLNMLRKRLRAGRLTVKLAKFLVIGGRNDK